MKTLVGGRYFDATDILMIKPEVDTLSASEPVKIDSKPHSEHPAPPAGWDASGKVETAPEVIISAEPASVTVAPERKKPGRPKKK